MSVDVTGPSPRRRRALALVGSCAVISVLVRLPLLGLPLDPDEGGYAYLARRWAAGGQLYREVWVDRPQGLMLAFRALMAVSYSPLAIRCGAVMAAVVVTLAAGSAAWALAGERAATAAALLTAVVGAGAFVQGYQFNGELAGSALASTGVAVALWWWRGHLADGWLLAAGALCAGAPLMKQSALDGMVVLVAVVLARSDRRLRHLLPAGVGAALPPATAALNAVTTGWARWWFAVVTFQSSIAAAVSWTTRVGRLGQTLLEVSPDLAGLGVVAVIATVSMTRDRSGRWPAALWAGTAVVFAAVSPFGHPHYWIQTVAPLAVTASIAVVRFRARAGVALLLVALAAPALIQGFLAAQTPARKVALVFHADRQRRADQAIATWLRAHSAPTDQVYAFVASGDLYVLADRDTGYPYLWLIGVDHVPDAVTLLHSWLDGGTAPRWVVVYQQPQTVDPSGSLAQVLSRRYRQVTMIQGYPVLEHAR